MTKTRILLTLLVTLVLLQNCSRPSEEQQKLEAMIDRFAPVDMTVDLSRLSSNQKAVLRKLVQATYLMDSIYLQQVWVDNLSVLKHLQADQTPEGKARLRYFQINMSPWSSLDDNEPFVEGVPERPAGANHYPSDMTKEEFTAWVKTLSKDDQASATGYFTVIRRGDAGALMLRPYSDEYRDELTRAATLLKEAAVLAGNQTLARYLDTRADAFLSNDYYESDVAWMDLDSDIEPTIGPYEVYMDGLFNYKAAFESFIAIRNEEESNKLTFFSQHLQDIEDHLPIKPEFRNPKLGVSSPIRVVDEIIVGGEAREAVQTAAYNLPNDERVVEEKGSKRVMLKNVQEAKFTKVLVPIAAIAVSPDQQALLSFDQFFTHILAHELMHGLGPQNITVNGRSTTVRKELKELNSALEEAKADISGLFALQYLMDKGVLDSSNEKALYATYLASSFRSVRFGIGGAHGRGMALQFNYLLDEGAFVYDKEKQQFHVNYDMIKDAVTKLTSEILTLQAEGDYERGKELLEKYAIVRPEMQSVLDRLQDIPVDIAPRFVTAEALLSEKD